MSDVNLFIKPCPEIQDDLIRVYLNGRYNPLDVPRDHEISLQRWLASEQNESGLVQRVVPGGGKKQQVQLLYTPPILASEVGDSCEINCNPGGETGERSEIYEIGDRCAEIKRSFSLDELADSCHDDGDWIAKVVLNMMGGMKKRIELELWEDITPLIGAFGAGEQNVDPVTNIKTVSTQVSGQPNRRFITDIEHAAMNAGYPDIGSVLFGYDEIWKAMKDLEAGCCANGGTDLRALFEQFNVRLFANSAVVKPALFGVDNFIQMAPMAVQFLRYNKYSSSPDNNIRHVDDDTQKRTTILDPQTGVSYDMNWSSGCDGDITISLRLRYKAVALPDDMFDTGDRYDGVRMLNRYVISNS